MGVGAISILLPAEPAYQKSGQVKQWANEKFMDAIAQAAHAVAQGANAPVPEAYQQKGCYERCMYQVPKLQQPFLGELTQPRRARCIHCQHYTQPKEVPPLPWNIFRSLIVAKYQLVCRV